VAQLRMILPNPGWHRGDDHPRKMRRTKVVLGNEFCKSQIPRVRMFRRAHFEGMFEAES
jgi:hypothetical protein